MRRVGFVRDGLPEDVPLASVLLPKSATNIEYADREYGCAQRVTDNIQQDPKHSMSVRLDDSGTGTYSEADGLSHPRPEMPVDDAPRRSPRS